MGLIQKSSSLVDIANDANLRCDPSHFINIDVSTNLRPISPDYTLASILESISNGVNFAASNYSLVPTENIYISVTEFDKGIPLITDKRGKFRESISFLSDEIQEEQSQDFQRGKINENEIIIARSGAIGKVAWFGEFIKNHPDHNLIASGFTTRLLILEGNDIRFVNLWLNLPFVTHYLIAKSSGKCQRNIAQEYIYSIPFPSLNEHIQSQIADRFHGAVCDFEQSVKDLPTRGELVDDALRKTLDLSLDLPSNKGILDSTDNLINIGNRYCLRCDAKQQQEYYLCVLSILDKIRTKQFGDLLQEPFTKGTQPEYLEDQETEGIPVISTLAIQDLEIVPEACRKISFEHYADLPEVVKPQTGDILITVDGVVSVGKPVQFRSDETFGIDSHIARVRLANSPYTEIVPQLLGSTICQAQFRLYESGATSRSINEAELRRIRIPELNAEQIENFNSIYYKSIEERDETAANLNSTRSDLYEQFVAAVCGALN